MYHVRRLNFKTNHVVFSDSYHVLVGISFHTVYKDRKDYKKHRLNIGDLHTATNCRNCTILPDFASTQKVELYSFLLSNTLLSEYLGADYHQVLVEFEKKKTPIRVPFLTFSRHCRHFTVATLSFVATSFPSCRCFKAVSLVRNFNTQTGP